MGKYSKSEEEWHTELDQYGVDLIHYDCPLGKCRAILTIRCRTCGTEDQARADNLTRRKTHPCPACANYQFYTTDTIKKLIESHGGVYLGGEVTGKYSKVRLICPGCGSEVYKTAHDVRRSPKSCRECRGSKISRTQLLRNNNLAKAQQIAKERGGICLAGKETFRSDEKLPWQCSLGHTWESTLECVGGQGTWCPSCGVNNRSENLVRALLKAAFGLPFPRVRPEFLQGLELDCYNADLGLAIEVDGIQHFQQSAHFHATMADFEQQQANDKKKRDLCSEEGITLINIPYFAIDEGVDATRDYLAQQLEKTGVRPQRDVREVTIDPRQIYDMNLDQTYQALAQAVADRKGSFNSADYLGISRKIAVTCEQGHRWSTYPYSIINGHWCPQCAKNQPPSLDEIDDQLHEHGWSLDRSQPLEYGGAHQKLPMICACGNPAARSWNKWQQKRKQLKDGETLKCDGCLLAKNRAEFFTKMEDRGFAFDQDGPAYRGEGQELTGICLECGVATPLRVEQWKNRAVADCCGRSLPPYHRCHEKVMGG